MGSIPVNKIIPSIILPKRSRRSSNCMIRCEQQSAKAVSPAAESVSVSASPGVEAARLEPRVEERDGYWVLKEKFRDGINPAEKVKIEEDPMKLFVENGISEIADLSMEEIDKSKHFKDDVDVRLKWLGLFHRRKHQCKFFFIPILTLI